MICRCCAQNSASRSTLVELCIANQRLRFLPQRAVFWIEQRTLLLADLHIGKAGHLRKAGIALSSAAQQSDLERLAWLIASQQAGQVFILGDLFHSTQNQEWQGFQRFLELYPTVNFTLVPGNHDRFFLQYKHFERLHVVTQAIHHVPPYVFSHEPLPENALPQGSWNVCGHIHPGLVLQGKGGLRDTLPCFWLQRQTLVLPAFGALTGLSRVKLQPDHSAIAIAGQECVVFEANLIHHKTRFG